MPTAATTPPATLRAVAIALLSPVTGRVVPAGLTAVTALVETGFAAGFSVLGCGAGSGLVSGSGLTSGIGLTLGSGFGTARIGCNQVHVTVEDVTDVVIVPRLVHNPLPAVEVTVNVCAKVG